MPELPEVETIVRRYRPKLVGRTITSFTTRWPKKVYPSATIVRRRLTNQTISSVGRRGKYIVLDLESPGHLLIHLRMSGRLEWAADHANEVPHVRAIWRFSDGNALWFVDSRKFGTIRWTNDLAAATQNVGLEPLDRSFTRKRLAGELVRRSRQIKPLLLDQTVIAGLGNIYVDESLFAAGIHPLTRSNDLRDEQLTALHRAIRTVLRRGIRHNGTSIDWIYPSGQMQNYLRVYGRTGEPCPSCGVPIEAIRVAQRGTHYCPRCQPNPPAFSAVPPVG